MNDLVDQAFNPFTYDDLDVDLLCYEKYASLLQTSQKYRRLLAQYDYSDTAFSTLIQPYIDEIACETNRIAQVIMFAMLVRSGESLWNNLSSATHHVIYELIQELNGFGSVFAGKRAYDYFTFYTHVYELLYLEPDSDATIPMSEYDDQEDYDYD